MRVRQLRLWHVAKGLLGEGVLAGKVCCLLRHGGVFTQL